MTYPLRLTDDQWQEIRDSYGAYRWFSHFASVQAWKSAQALAGLFPLP